VHPKTDFSEFTHLIEKFDFILIMTVVPGFGAQKFIDRQLDLIKKVRQHISLNKLNTKIQIDGGINHTNLKALHEMKIVDLFVVGAFLFNNINNLDETLEKLITN
jgi:ribulose-phosphate 3-epimerase